MATKSTARVVISNADPKRTLLGLVEAQHLQPSFLQRLQHYRMHGTVAKINLALNGLPKFKDVDGDAAALLSGRIQISPEIDYLERAFDASKYGEFSAASLPGSYNSHIVGQLARASGQTRDVDLHAVCALQIAGCRLGCAARRSRRHRHSHACGVRARTCRR